MEYHFKLYHFNNGDYFKQCLEQSSVYHVRMKEDTYNTIKEVTGIENSLLNSIFNSFKLIEGFVIVVLNDKVEYLFDLNKEFYK